MKNTEQRKIGLTTTEVALLQPVLGSQKAIAFEFEPDFKTAKSNILLKFPCNCSLVNLTDRTLVCQNTDSYKTNKKSLEGKKMFAVVTNIDNMNENGYCISAVVLSGLKLQPDGSGRVVEANMTVKLTYGMAISNPVKFCRELCSSSDCVYYDLDDITGTEANINGYMFKAIGMSCKEVLRSRVNGINDPEKIRETVLGMKEETGRVLNAALAQAGLYISNRTFSISVDGPFGPAWNAYKESTPVV